MEWYRRHHISSRLRLAVCAWGIASQAAAQGSVASDRAALETLHKPGCRTV